MKVESLPAQVTVVRPFASVNPDVFFNFQLERIFRVKLFTLPLNSSMANFEELPRPQTVLSTRGLQLSHHLCLDHGVVSFDMFLEGALGRELFRTEGTLLVPDLFGVGPVDVLVVPDQGGLLLESLPAQVALVRPFTSVNPHVLFHG